MLDKKNSENPWTSLNAPLLTAETPIEQLHQLRVQTPLDRDPELITLREMYDVYTISIHNGKKWYYLKDQLIAALNQHPENLVVVDSGVREFNLNQGIIVIPGVADCLVTLITSPDGDGYQGFTNGCHRTIIDGYGIDTILHLLEQHKQAPHVDVTLIGCEYFTEQMVAFLAQYSQQTGVNIPLPIIPDNTAITKRIKQRASELGIPKVGLNIRYLSQIKADRQKHLRNSTVPNHTIFYGTENPGHFFVSSISLPNNLV